MVSAAPSAAPDRPGPDGNPKTHNLELRDLWNLRGVLVIGVLEACVMSVLAHIYLPYARSIQHCEHAPDAAALADVHSASWSGTRGCDDRDYVTREAQSLVSMGQGITLGLCCLVLPSFGVLADRIGRWKVIAIYFTGVALVCISNALFPSNATFLVSRSLSGALGDPHPIAHAQIADVCAPDVRCARARPPASRSALPPPSLAHRQPRRRIPPPNRAARSSCFAFVLVVKMIIGSIAGLASNYAIVGQHVYDYTAVWLALAGGACLLVLGCFCFEETHPRFARRAQLLARGEKPEPERAPASAHAGLGLTEALRVVSQPVLRHVILVSSLCVCGLSSWSVAGGWVIITYGWPQERFGYVSLALLPAAIVALAVGPRLQRALGVGRYLAGATAMMLASLVCLDLAFLHQVFFFLALALVSGAFSSAPAFMAATTLIVSEEDQGKTQGAVSATFHGVSALSLSLYGMLFKAQALLPGHVVSLCFWVGTAFVALGAAYGYKTRTWHDLSEAGKNAGAELRDLGADGDLTLEAAPSELEARRGLGLAPVVRIRTSSRSGHVELR